MIVYLGKTPLLANWDSAWLLKKAIKEHSIISVLPLFDDEAKAIEFCGKDWYLKMAQWE